MTDKEKLIGIRKAIKTVISYPPKGSNRRTKNGYPKEFDYDRFAYERMIDSVRCALKEILKEFK